LLLGLFGFKEWTNVQHQLTDQLAETSAYQVELAQGFSLLNGKEWGPAAVQLRKALDYRPNDETVATALLDALQEAGRWPDFVQLANSLNRGKNLTAFGDPWLKNLIGLALLYQGRDQRDELQKAREYLEDSASYLSGDPNERAVRFNLWIYYLFVDDRPQAQREFDLANRARSLEYPNQQWTLGQWMDQLSWGLITHLSESNKSMLPSANSKRPVKTVFKV
jgi:hypothetical protein